MGLPRSPCYPWGMDPLPSPDALRAKLQDPAAALQFIVRWKARGFSTPKIAGAEHLEPEQLLVATANEILNKLEMMRQVLVESLPRVRP